MIGGAGELPIGLLLSRRAWGWEAGAFSRGIGTHVGYKSLEGDPQVLDTLDDQATSDTTLYYSTKEESL